MFRQFTLTCACIALLATSAAAGPDALQRSGKWEVNYDRDACHLAASFGTGDDTMLLRFSRYEPDNYFSLSLYGKRLPNEGSRVAATIDFGLAAKPFETYGLNGSAGALKAALLGNTRIDAWKAKVWDDKPPPITPAQEGQVTGVGIAIKSTRSSYKVRLEFGALAKPFAQLRNCTTELVRRWGYDPSVQATLTRKPTPTKSPQTWMKNTDFPEHASKKGQTGVVHFRLDVGADGKVLGCYVLDRTDPDAFADLTCKLISSRAALKPALDAEGKPVRSYFVESVSWQ